MSVAGLGRQLPIGAVWRRSRRPAPTAAVVVVLVMAAGCGTEATSETPASVTLIQPEAVEQATAATAATSTTVQQAPADSQTPITAPLLEGDDSAASH